jgi:hypothetical protein
VVPCIPFTVVVVVGTSNFAFFAGCVGLETISASLASEHGKKNGGRTMGAGWNGRQMQYLCNLFLTEI